MHQQHHGLSSGTIQAISPLPTTTGKDPRLRYLAWSRIALGSLFLLRTTPLFVFLRFPFEADPWPLLGWPDEHWTGAGWLRLPDAVTAAACVARTAAATCFLLGVHARVAGLAAGLLGYLVMLQHPFGAAFTLHLLFQGVIVLALGDCASALAWRPEAPSAPRSSVQLVRWFVASIYFWAGVGKLRPDWLDGRTLALFQSDGAFHGWASHALLSTSTSRAVCASTVAFTELALPWLLLWRRTERLGLAFAFALHAAIELAARPDVLGWEMAALLLALWPVRLQEDGSRDPLPAYSHANAGAGQPMKP
jgi:hypothetical protein